MLLKKMCILLSILLLFIGGCFGGNENSINTEKEPSQSQTYYETAKNNLEDSYKVLTVSDIEKNVVTPLTDAKNKALEEGNDAVLYNSNLLLGLLFLLYQNLKSYLLKVLVPYLYF